MRPPNPAGILRIGSETKTIATGRDIHTEGTEESRERELGARLMQWREILLRRTFSVTALIVLIPMAVFSIQERRGIFPTPVFVLGMSLYALLLGVILLPNRFQKLKALGLLVFFLALGIAASTMGIVVGVGVGYLCFMTLAGLLFGVRGAGLSLATSLLCLLGVGFALSRGWLPSYHSPAVLDPTSFPNWVRAGLLVTSLGAGLSFSVALLMSQLQSRLRESERLRSELRAEMQRREDVEEKMVRAQRLEALGRLAGGVAHDFNNTLTLILLEIERLQDRHGDGPDGPVLSRILESAEGAADLVAQLLLISRRTDLMRPRRIDLVEMLHALKPTLDRLLGPDIEVHVEGGDQPCWVRADRGQLQQALMNVTLNGRDAMGTAGGTLILRVRHRLVEEDSVLTAGDYVCLEIEDTGSGMNTETASRVFEPFFTTKDVGQGTGLGLASAYGFAQACHGTLEVWSEVGTGSRFTFVLPASEPPDVAEDGVQASSRDVGRSGRVVLAEDEAAVRGVLEDMLGLMGFEVQSVPDGLQAYELLQAMDSPPGLLVTDVVMPHMTGSELVEKVHRTWPDMKVLVITGHADRSTLASLRLRAGTVVLTKPFRQAELEAALETLLGPDPGGGHSSSCSGANSSVEAREASGATP